LTGLVQRVLRLGEKMKLPVYVFLSPYATVGIDNLDQAQVHDLTIYTRPDMGTGYVLVGQTEVEFDLRSKDQVAADMIQQLQIAKDLLIEEHQEKLQKINDQLANMMALSYEA
jgi:hypothetical protein